MLKLTVIIRIYEFNTRLRLFILSLRMFVQNFGLSRKGEIYLQKNKGHERTVYTILTERLSHGANNSEDCITQRASCST